MKIRPTVRIFLWAIGATAGIGVLAFGYTAWRFGEALDDMCESMVEREVPSPDGRLKVVIFQVDCGATTGFHDVRKASIVPVELRKVPTEGNLISGTKSNFLPEWKSPSLLEIRHGDRGIREPAEVAGVRIRWKPAP